MDGWGLDGWLYLQAGLVMDSLTPGWIDNWIGGTMNKRMG